MTGSTDIAFVTVKAAHRYVSFMRHGNINESLMLSIFFYQLVRNETFKPVLQRHLFWLPAIGRGIHPIPFRTRKLNSAPSTVVVLS
jgi:hypothetical protein